jgi:hypothetical protein
VRISPSPPWRPRPRTSEVRDESLHDGLHDGVHLRRLAAATDADLHVDVLELVAASEQDGMVSSHPINHD